MEPCIVCASRPNISAIEATTVIDGIPYCELHMPQPPAPPQPPAKPLSELLGDGAFERTVDAADVVGIKQHTGNKYIRTIVPPPGCERGQTDVYAVLEAFNVRCPAVQHAVKKLLCAGIRGKGSPVQDLKEAYDAIARAVQMQQARDVDAG